jgi:hypothetical protein
VQAVNWQNVLDFTHLFRGFRLAINPAKLVLALLAILLIYSAGRLFDAVWGPQVYPGEVTEFALQRGDLVRLRTRALSARTDTLESLLRAASVYDDSLAPRIDTLSHQPAAAYRALKKAYRARFDEAVKKAREDRLAAEKDAASRTTSAPGVKTPAEAEQDARAIAASRLLENVRTAHEAAGLGIFDTFLTYEIAQFDQLVENTLTFVRVSPVRTSSSAIGDGIEGSAVSGGLLSKNPDRLWRSDTVAGCIANMTITAPRWLFTGTAPMQWRPDNVNTWGGWLKMVIYRIAYLATLIALTVFSLLVLAFTGASISRLSALELAGHERIPLKDVFIFAGRRLWIFVKAPVAPFLILLIFGLLLAIGGLIGAIPFVGEILLGMVFIVFLAVAFVLMLLLLGIIGGFNLLYPTIAVEGSDAFDAMSRSFAYVYARPWRLILYTVTALIYGVITFLFVSFAVYLILLLTHTFVGWGTSFFGAHYGWYSGSLKLDTLWPMPRFMRLVMPINWYAMSWTEYLGALFLHFWLFLLITTIGAYVISYYFSCHTIMYLLLRRAVDGQSIREVFVDAPETTSPASEQSPIEPPAPPPAALPAIRGNSPLPAPSHPARRRTANARLTQPAGNHRPIE